MNNNKTNITEITMNNKQKTYELPDDVFNIVKSFMISKYRKIKHFPLMKELIITMPSFYSNYIATKERRPYHNANRFNETVSYEKLQVELGIESFIYYWNESMGKVLKTRSSKIIARKWIENEIKDGTYDYGKQLELVDYVDLYMYGEFSSC